MTQPQNLHGKVGLKSLILLGGGSLLICAAMGFVFWASDYLIDSQENLQKENLNASWLKQAAPLLEQIREDGFTSEVKNEQSVLVLVNQLADKHSVRVERADYQGDLLRVSLMKASFERAVSVMNDLELLQGVRVSSVSIYRMSDGMSRLNFVIEKSGL